MVNIAQKYKLSKEDQKACFIIGLNHDIGYEFLNNYESHGKVGG